MSANKLVELYRKAKASQGLASRGPVLGVAVGVQGDHLGSKGEILWKIIEWNWCLLESAHPDHKEKDRPKQREQKLLKIRIWSWNGFKILELYLMCNWDCRKAIGEKTQCKGNRKTAAWCKTACEDVYIDWCVLVLGCLHWWKQWLRDQRGRVSEYKREIVHCCPRTPESRGNRPENKMKGGNCWCSISGVVGALSQVLKNDNSQKQGCFPRRGRWAAPEGRWWQNQLRLQPEIVIVCFSPFSAWFQNAKYVNYFQFSKTIKNACLRLDH